MRSEIILGSDISPVFILYEFLSLSIFGGMTSNMVISLILPLKSSLTIDLASRIPIIPAAPIINIFIMPSCFVILA